MLCPRKTYGTNADRAMSIDSRSTASPSPSPISASQVVFSSSPSFSPDTNYVVVPVTLSRLVDLLQLEQRKRINLRASFQLEIGKSQKTFDALERRLDRKVNRMQNKQSQQTRQALLCKISVLEDQLAQSVVCQHRQFQKMASNQEALQRIESMMHELTGAQQARDVETASAKENFYCIHVPCTDQTVKMMKETGIDTQTVRFTAETN